VKRGFEFTLMVVGEFGLGKSTVVNSLFLSGKNSSHILEYLSADTFQLNLATLRPKRVFSISLN